MPEDHKREYLNLSYRSGGSESQMGDLYLPTCHGPYSIVVLMHGGGWIRGHRRDMRKTARQLVSAGFAVFNISYRLAPKNRYPAQLEDIHAALRFLQQNSNEWQIDVSKITTAGYSAGAHLALLAAQIKDPEGPSIHAIVAGGAPIDFSLYPRSPLITRLIGSPPHKAPESWRTASPITHLSPSHPPVFLFHARWDLIVKYKSARQMKQILEDFNVPVELHTHYIYGHLSLGRNHSNEIAKAINFIKAQSKSSQISS